MKKITLFFIINFSCIISMYSQAPANNICSGAIEIPNIDNTCDDILVTIDVSVTDSGELPDPGDCANYQGADLWYKLEIPATGGVTITTSESDGSIDDGGLAVYTGACGSLELYACTDDTNPIDITMEELDVAYTVGETIYIRVWSYGANQLGTFYICAEQYTPPSMATNDDCAESTNLPIDSICVNTTGSNNATNSEIGDPTIPHPTPDEDCGYYLGRDVWYDVIVPSTGRFAVETSADNGSIEDTGMAIYSGNCNPNGLVFVACNDDADGNSLYSRIELSDRNPGETLFVRVWSWGNEELGSFNICAIELPTLNNKEFDINTFSLYPNPTTDLVNLKFGQTNKTINVNIYDLQGKLVLQTLNNTTQNNRLQLNISSLKTGMYFVKINDKQSSLTQKLIVR